MRPFAGEFGCFPSSGIQLFTTACPEAEKYSSMRVDLDMMSRLKVAPSTQQRESREMISIEVKDMTCGHCEATLRKAVSAVDAGARVTVDLAARRLEIESSVDSKRFIDAVRTAGYTPAAASEVVANGGAARQKSGCCCR